MRRAVCLLAPALLCLPGLPLASDGVWADGPILALEDEDLTQELFNVLVTNGTTFVVHGTARNSGLFNWTCDSIRADPVFRGAEAKLSYGGDGSVQLSSEWESNVVSTKVQDLDEKAPKTGSLYFGIKDIQFADAESPPSWTTEMLEKIREHTHLPVYMDYRNIWRTNHEGLSELESLHVSPELWLSPPGAGAQAHMDSHVSSTLSLQLSGRKRWRLSQPPERTSVAQSPEFGDGEVYRRKPPWTPHYDFVLEEGDALFFPPGTVHETSNVGNQCATSVTYQFSVPMASRYYRSLIRRFRRCGDMQESWDLMERWVAVLGRELETWGELYGGKGEDRRLTLPTLVDVTEDSDQAAAMRDALAFVDVDGDWTVTPAELRAAAEDLQRAAVPEPTASAEL
mmetsp:Transcript_39888/g.124403  ORF Transcript_39888/g.124403 Transcript_39888/m.124403 type:complete len:398 (-) Transcript_39888:88-1281(-)